MQFFVSLQRIYEVGIYNYAERVNLMASQYFASREIAKYSSLKLIHPNDDKEPQVLHLPPFSGLFIMMSCIYTFSFIFCVIEICYKHFT